MALLRVNCAYMIKSNITWFKQAKYGLFIHFGLYSVLAGEYKGEVCDGYAEWIMNYMDIPVEEYRELAKTFDPINFDSDEICAFAKDSGFRYLCFTAKHHEGFAMYHSKVSSYNSYEGSPCHRDFVAELAVSCRKYGLKFCLYYSQAQDWDDPNGLEAFKNNEGKNFASYFYNKCLPQVQELLSNYGDIAMLWFDTPMDMPRELSQALVATVKATQPNCLISGRIGYELGDYLTTQDNRLPALPIEKAWEIPATTNQSWGYSRWDNNWRSSDELLLDLIRIVARGGNMLLNIGPKANGQLPSEAVASVRQVGQWLESNADSIYGSSAITPYVYEMPELYFTHKKNKLYLHILHAQTLKGRELPLPHIRNNIKACRYLNSDASCNIRQTKTLEGNPYWGVSLPKNMEGDFWKQSVITIEVDIEEEDFLQESL